MLKRFNILFLSLIIIVLGSSFAGASSFDYGSNGFTNYKVDSNFYDTYTQRVYNYSWDVSIWTRPWTKKTETVPSVPTLPNPEKPKPETPIIPEAPIVPEAPKPEVPVIPEKPEPEVPETPKPEVPEDKPQEPVTPPVTDTGMSQVEKEVIRLVNIERQKNGLSPFTASSDLSNVARVKSKDMADNNYFSHQSPKYGSPFEMMKSFGINYRTAAENIAKGYSSAESVVRGWMNSQGHRENILNPSFNTIGVGAFTSSNGTIYWTQMFTN